MDPTIELTDIAGFYDALAPDYDSMTGFEQRFAQEGPFFRLLISRHHIARAVDAGAGTGSHSLLLARLGVAVTAVDLSQEMLHSLERHAADAGASIETVRADFISLPAHVAPASVDAVFCMGNALAHCENDGALRAALSAFHSVLRPGGILFAQLLNYDRILARRERVVSVKDAGGCRFIRYYTYGRDTLRFNILTLRCASGRGSRTLRSVSLQPFGHVRMTSALAAAGFHAVRLFGGVRMDAFRSESSRDLVVLAAGDDTALAT